MWFVKEIIGFLLPVLGKKLIVWFENRFCKTYKVCENHDLIQLLRILQRQRFSTLEKKMSYLRAKLSREFFCNYKIDVFLDWALYMVKYIEKNKSLPNINRLTILGLVDNYNNRAIEAWEKEYNGNKAMRIFVEKFHKLHLPAVEMVGREVESLMSKGLNPDETLDLIFDFIKEAFQYSLINIDETISSLNGELTIALEEWRDYVRGQRNKKGL